jgi:DNA-binding transcriptional regulator GbsR (MarR family)
MKNEVVDRFVESWGSMGMLWGVNRSIARIHALLIVSERPLSLDEIAERLQMSRGNTSMSLRELRTWNVIKRIKVPGDRRDFYESEPDIWKMFFLIFGERKRREFDPALAAVREALAAAKGDRDEAAPDSPDVDSSSTGTNEVVGRLAQMAELLGTMERVMSRFLANEKTSRSMLRFLTGWIGDE